MQRGLVCVFLSRYVQSRERGSVAGRSREVHHISIALVRFPSGPGVSLAAGPFLRSSHCHPRNTLLCHLQAFRKRAVRRMQ